jgi:hypothetical protein
VKSTVFVPVGNNRRRTRRFAPTGPSSKARTSTKRAAMRASRRGDRRICALGKRDVADHGVSTRSKYSRICDTDVSLCRLAVAQAPAD